MVKTLEDNIFSFIVWIDINKLVNNVSDFSSCYVFRTHKITFQAHIATY